MNFRIDEIEKRARNWKKPILLSYAYGEIGAYTPYQDKNVNVCHGGIIQSLGFK